MKVKSVKTDEIMEATVVPCLELVVPVLNVEDNGQQDCNGGVSTVSQALNITIFGTMVSVSEPNNMGIDGSLKHKVASHEESLSSTTFLALEKPMNFDVFSSATELEVLGLERLKSELQLFVIRIHLNSCYALVRYVFSGVKGYTQKLYIEIENAYSAHLAILESIVK
ncbi:hypothetical protein RJT34_08044 [Clitoria ternatea]|uniref:SDE2/SF3A3 SAP domain-containing protein n=1 Tax=Clitoria ternatea TaxID=43366 RepID=A0AAN9PTV4_CLITE